MFNLFRSQGKAVKYMLSLLLFLVAASMLVYLVPQYGTDQTGSEATLLQVGDTKLSSADALRQFQQTYKQVPPDQLPSLFPVWFQEAKQRYAILEAARRIGLKTSNQEAAETIATIPALAGFFQDGKLTNPDAFQQTIAQQGYTPDGMFAEARDMITADKLQKAIAETSAVSEKDIEDAYKKKNDRASVDYMAFLDSDFGSQIKISDADVEARYNLSKANYMEPGKSSFRVVVLSQDAVLSKLTVTDQELRSEYSKSLDNFTVPEQVHIRHILFTTAGKSDSEKEAIRKKAEDVLKQVRGGLDFEQAMKKYSEDTAPDIAPFARGSYDKSFEDAAFALKPKEISGVVLDKFGYHIIQLMDRVPAKVTPFETARTEIEKVLRQQKLGDTMDKELSALQAELKKDPANAASIALKHGAQLVNVPEAKPGDAIPTLGAAPEVDKALAVMQPGNVSDPVFLPGDRVALVILDKRIPARPSALAEVKDKIKAALATEALTKLVQDKGKEAAKRLRAGEDIQTVAKALGSKVQSASSFGITDTLPDLGPAVYFEDAFTKAPGTVIGPVLMQSRWVVAKVVSKTPADMNGLATARKTLLQTIRQDRAEQNDSLWRDSIVEKLDKEGAIKVNMTEYQRIISQARP